VDVPRRLADALAVGGEEGDHVVVELAVQLVDALGLRRRGLLDRHHVVGRHQAAAEPGARHGDLDLGEQAEALALAPDGAHLGQGVAGDHGIRAAGPRRAAA
jgi:hypothetical protein